MTLRVLPVPFGPVAVGVRTFTRRGERRLVAVVKVTCELVDGEAMRVLAPSPVTDRDLGLRVPQAQVIVAGSCHASPGLRGVRVAVARGGRSLLDRQVDAQPGDPVGLGPLPPSSPVRCARLGRASQHLVDSAFDVALPDDFDDTYFQAVPPDQCASEPLVGGDLVLLAHLHPQLLTIRTTIPAGTAVALLQTDRGQRRAIKLRLDTLTCLPEAMRAELVWRGDIRVDDESLRDARVGGAHGRGENDFPDLAATARAPGAGPVFAGAAAELRPDATQIASFDHHSPSPAPRRGREGTMVLEASAPASSPPAEAPRRQRAHAGTMILEGPAAAPAEDEEAAPPTMAMPFPGPAQGRAPRVDATLEIADDRTSDGLPEHAPRSMPFERRSSLPPDDPTRRAPVPGAPWSPQGVRRAPRAGNASTMVLESEPPPAPVVAPPLVAPPAVVQPTAPPPDAAPPPAATPAAEARAPRDPWRQESSSAPELAAPVRAPRQRVSFRSDLYKKLKK